jgi:hypothetical protein
MPIETPIETPIAKRVGELLPVFWRGSGMEARPKTRLETGTKRTAAKKKVAKKKEVRA